MPLSTIRHNRQARPAPVGLSLFGASSSRRVAVAAALAFGLASGAGAQSAISDASALSTLPIAVSVAAPVAMLSTGAALLYDERITR